MTNSIIERAFDKATDELAKMPQVELEVQHHFSPGVYAREMFIPAGVLLVGKIHKTDHLCILSRGVIRVASKEGNEVIKSPCTFQSKAGIQRMGMAITDVVFTTIHATHETDIDQLENDLVVETYEQYDQYVLEQSKKLSCCNHKEEA